MGRTEKIDLPQCSPVLTTLGLWFIEDREGHSEGIVHDYNSFFGNEEFERLSPLRRIPESSTRGVQTPNSGFGISLRRR